MTLREVFKFGGHAGHVVAVQMLFGAATAFFVLCIVYLVALFLIDFH